MTTNELKMSRYHTMNSWNNSTAPAFNLKVYNVIPSKLQDKVFELMDCEEFYNEINGFIYEFDHKHNHNWQAGFNGRSGGYLVLYQGGIKDGRPFSYPGLGIETDEVPKEILKSFRKLAENIVSYTIELAKNSTVKEEEYVVIKKRKVIA